MKICFVTNQLGDLDNNGGIGTATQYICEHLASCNYNITIAYQGLYHINKKELNKYSKKMSKLGIDIMYIEGYSNTHPPEHNLRYRVYECLKNTDFDIYIFSDWLAQGIYCFEARESGIAFQNAKLGVITHSSTQWCDQCNNVYPNTLETLALYDIEQACVEKADFVVSPSHYMIDWLKEQKYKLPQYCCAIHNLVSPPNKNTTKVIIGKEEKEAVEIDEIVFFGRLEQRKGIIPFIHALNTLSWDILKNVNITFLGSECAYNSDTIMSMIADAVKDIVNEITIISDYSSLDARKYLKSGNRLAVMPSLEDNSPCVVYECLEENIPMIISNKGGGKELIAEQDRARVTFEPTKNGIVNKITEILSESRYFKPASASWTHAGIIEDWDKLFKWAEKDVNKKVKTGKAEPLVSVVITHYNRHYLLKHSLCSILKQDYQNIEVIIVDDGSTDSASVEYLKAIEAESYNCNVRIIRQENQYLGAARNRGIQEASGEYIIFFDDDNIAFPNMISTFVNAIIGSQAQVCTSGMKYLHKASGKNQADDESSVSIIFLGGNVTNVYGIFVNTFGDATAIYDKKALLATNGFHEKHGVTYEDWTMHVELKLNGAKSISIPEPLFWYRITETSMSRTTDVFKNFQELLKPYRNALPDSLRLLPDCLIGLCQRVQELEQHSNVNIVKNYPRSYRMFCSAKRVLNMIPFSKKIKSALKQML